MPRLNPIPKEGLPPEVVEAINSFPASADEKTLGSFLHVIGKLERTGLLSPDGASPLLHFVVHFSSRLGADMKKVEGMADLLDTGVELLHLREKT